MHGMRWALVPVAALAAWGAAIIIGSGLYIGWTEARSKPGAK